MPTNRVRSLTRISSDRDRRIADAKLDIAYGVAMQAILGGSTPPEGVLFVMNKAHDVLRQENVPMHTWIEG